MSLLYSSRVLLGNSPTSTKRMGDNSRYFNPSDQGDKRHTSQQGRRRHWTPQQAGSEQTDAQDHPTPTCNTGGMNFVRYFLASCHSGFQHRNFPEETAPSAPPQSNIDVLVIGPHSSSQEILDSNTQRDVSPLETIPTDRPEVHRGSSRDTLQGLLKDIIGKVKIDIRKDTSEGLADTIYDLSVKNGDQTQVPFSITSEQYQLALSNIPVSEDIVTRKDRGYMFYENTKAEKRTGEEYFRRIALNIHPDRLIGTATSMVQNIVPLRYVKELKVVSDVDEPKRTDNIIIYFNDSAGMENLTELGKKLLDSYAEDTQPSHPAMMEPIDPKVQGIAFADQQGSESFTQAHVRLIADVLLNLESESLLKKPSLGGTSSGLSGRQEITPETLELEVKKRFEVYNIDPDNPHRLLSTNLGETQRTPRAMVRTKRP